jgi:survival-of-motor-neuron-related-splicing factor 30
LLKLKDDLLQLVNLLKQANTETSSNETSKQSNESSNKQHSKVDTPTETSGSKNINKKKYKKGDVIMAKWSEDKQFYEATILDVLSPTSYQIVFNGYGNEEIVNDYDIKEVTSKVEVAQTTNDKKRPYSAIVAAPSTELTNPHAIDQERKKKIKKKKEANINKKEQEQVQKQKAWNFFAKHNSKISKNVSIFKTPTEYNGKVGFSGSGRPMTKFSERKKHIY